MGTLEVRDKKKALVIATVGGFLQKFEMGDARVLQGLGYEVHYAANLGNPVYRLDRKELEDAGIRLHDVAIEKSPFALAAHRRALRGIVALMEAEGIGLVHCHTPVGGFLGRMAGKKACGGRRGRDNPGNGGVKVIYTSHGFHFYEGAPFPEGFIFKCVERYLARFTDALVTINREDYVNACRFRLRPGGKVYRIPGVGLDTGRFCPPAAGERRECRMRLGIPEDAFLLLSVGELNRNKNHRVVLEALALLGAGGPASGRGCPAEGAGGAAGKQAEEAPQGDNGRAAAPGNGDWTAGGSLLYGICGEGGARRGLEAGIARLGLEGKVTLYGYRDPRPYLAAADAFVFPSRREGLGMAALEALAMGVPVIAADNRGSREYMRPGRNGYVFAWDDPEGCAGCIRRLAGLAPGERAEMRRLCRESVGSFDAAGVQKTMEDIYRSVCGE